MTKIHKCHRYIESCRYNQLVALTHTYTQISVMLGKGEIYRPWVDQKGRQDRWTLCTEAKRRSFVFDSHIDWKPVQRVKMKCNVVFWEERLFPGTFQMRWAALFCTFWSLIRKYWGPQIQRGGGVATIQPWKNESRKVEYVRKFGKQKYCSLNLRLMGLVGGVLGCQNKTKQNTPTLLAPASKDHLGFIASSAKNSLILEWWRAHKIGFCVFLCYFMCWPQFFWGRVLILLYLIRIWKSSSGSFRHPSGKVWGWVKLYMYIYTAYEKHVRIWSPLLDGAFFFPSSFFPIFIQNQWTL